MNYGHWTGCNWLATDADGIISPDIIFMVHKAKRKLIYSKQIPPKLHIIWFQKGSAIIRYWAYTAVLFSSAQTRYSNAIPRKALRKITSQNDSMGFKVDSDGPQRTPVCPLRSQDAWVRVNQSHFAHNKKYSDTKWITATEPTITYCPQMQTA